MPEVDRAAAGRAAIAARRARAAVKETVHQRERRALDVAETAWADPTTPEGTLRVRELLTSIPGIGPTRVTRIMSDLGIADAKRVGGLGSRQRDTPAHSLGADASEKVSAIQAQLSELFARLTDSLPSKADVSQAAGHLSEKASKAYNGALNGAKHSLHGVSEAGANVTHTVAAHPLLTSVVLGAIGTVLASLAASSSSEAKKAAAPVPTNGAAPVDEASI